MKKIDRLGIAPFDSSDYLDSEETIAKCFFSIIALFQQDRTCLDLWRKAQNKHQAYRDCEFIHFYQQSIFFKNHQIWTSRIVQTSYHGFSKLYIPPQSSVILHQILFRAYILNLSLTQSAKLFSAHRSNWIPANYPDQNRCNVEFSVLYVK